MILSKKEMMEEDKYVSNSELLFTGVDTKMVKLIVLDASKDFYK